MFEYLEKYNYWSGAIPSVGMRREFYLNKILKSLELSLVKVLVGQRRVGKSYILRQVISSLLNNGVNPANIFYFTKEAFEFDEIKTAADLNEFFNQYLSKLKPQGKIYIFLDEIQLIEGWEKLVNHWAQSPVQKFEVFITGSNASLLSSELSTLLSGRYLTFHVLPFSFKEYCQYTQSDNSRDNFISFLAQTALPEALKIQDNELVISYFSSLFDTIILRDVVQRFRVRDLNLLKEIFVYILKNIGHLTSFGSIAKYYKSKGQKASYETVASYVDYLANTFSVHQSLRYSLKTKSVLGAERKLYVNDLGFVNYLQGYTPERLAGYLENYVFLSLLRYGYKVNTAVFDDKEIDFIASKHNRQLLVQVSQTLTDINTYRRETSYFLSSRNKARKLLIHLDDIDYTEPGVTFVKAWQLEEKLAVLDLV